MLIFLRFELYSIIIIFFDINFLFGFVGNVIGNYFNIDFLFV